MKDITPEIILSIGPKKDSTDGKPAATAVLIRNSVPKVVRPEKPTLPDLYQVNFL